MALDLIDRQAVLAKGYEVYKKYASSCGAESEAVRALKELEAILRSEPSVKQSCA